MLSTVRRKVHTASDILSRRGVLGLGKALLRSIVRRETFYVYEFTHRRNAPGGRGVMADMAAFVVTCNREADVLAAVRQDPRLSVRHAREALQDGAVLFCVYSGESLAHTAWLATSERSLRAIDMIGLAVPFEKGIAWTGRVWTSPHFRRRGLSEHGCIERFEYLLDRGLEHSRTTIGCDNIASLRMARKLGGTLVGRGHRLSVLGWRRWKEASIMETDLAHIRALTESD